MVVSCLEHPYELQLREETHRGAECFVITGRLSQAPGESEPDIAREFSYLIGKEDRLHSIHELTFGRRSIDIEFEKFELNQPLDPALFDLPDKPKAILSSFNQWKDLRGQEMMRMRSASSV